MPLATARTSRGSTRAPKAETARGERSHEQEDPDRRRSSEVRQLLPRPGEGVCRRGRCAGSETRVLSLDAIRFDPILRAGFDGTQPLEEDLVAAQEAIRWAEHLVFFYPVWWGTMPALLKGFIDRVFLPGFAFKYRSGSALWDRLLTGRTGELIVTMDSPPWYYRWLAGQPGHRMMKKTVLEFCGVRPVSVWETTMTMNGGEPIVQKMCFTPEVEKRVQATKAESCSRYEVRREGASWIVESTCTVPGKVSSGRVVTTGDFTSRIRADVSSTGADGTKNSMTLDARWLRPCGPKEKPGAIVR
jgi:putative NADPH-quinone reductase